MKIAVVPSSIENLDRYTKIGAKAFIFGLENFSINYPVVTISEIKKVIEENPNTEIFISMNKTIFNSELSSLEKILLELNTIPIKGVLFYDLSILSIYHKHKFNYDLVWHQTHMVTNYNTCNYYYDKGVRYGILASEITKDEMIEIKKRTKMKLFTYLIGHSIMAHSKRKLLTNYYESMNQDYDHTPKIIEEKDKRYIITETKDGTCILEGNIMNGTSYLQELNDAGIDYGIIDGNHISDILLEKLISLVNDILEKNSTSSMQEIIHLIGNDTGFFNKKTIFKVKKDEKKD